jgi:hypothetical protein
VRATWLALALLTGGCCRDGEPCPQNAVFVMVSAGGASVPGVMIEGYDFTCTEEALQTVCRPTVSIADGTYELIVSAPGIASQQLTLEVRTNPIPEYSCDCEIPSASAMIEVEAASDPDAGI